MPGGSDETLRVTGPAYSETLNTTHDLPDELRGGRSGVLPTLGFLLQQMVGRKPDSGACRAGFHVKLLPTDSSAKLSSWALSDAVSGSAVMTACS
jgi:hypothetical protein